MPRIVRQGASGSLPLHALLLLAKMALVRFMALGDAGAIHAIVLEGPPIVSGLLILDLLPPRFRRWGFIVFNLLVSILLLAIALFASYFDQLPSAGMLSVLNQSAAVKGSILNLLNPLHCLLFIDLPILILLSVSGGDRLPPASSKTRGPRLAWRHALILPGLVLGGMGLAGIRRLPLPLDSRATARGRGLFVYELSTFVDPPKGSGVAIPDQARFQARVQELEEAKAGGRIADFPLGVAKGRNLIVIQVEGLQAAVIDARVDGREVTPSLNRLRRESWYFPNTATAAGLGSTSDAEFVANTSLFPPPRAAASVKYANRVLPSLPRMLGDAGYQTLTYHTNWIGFWRRSDLYPALGFSRFFDQAFFGSEDRIAFGASDEVLFRRTLNDLVPRFQKGEPFYAFIITMSSHHPFDQIPQDRLRLPLPSPYAGTYAGRYLAAIEYADRAIGGFIEELRRTGLLDASVLVVYGDHASLHDRDQPRAELAAHRALLGRDLTPVDRLRVPLFIRMPRQNQGRTLTDPAGQIDVFPTLADVLGLNLMNTVHFGRDLFAGPAGMVPCSGFLPPGSYMEGDLLYVSGNPFEQGSVYRLSTGLKGPISLANPARQEASRELIRLSEIQVQRMPIRRPGP